MLKKILITIAIIVGIIIAIPIIGGLISGFSSSFNPKGAIDQAKKQAEETRSIVVPNGYEVIQYKSQTVVDGKVGYITKINKGNNEIMLVQKPDQTQKCSAKEKVFGQINTCYEEFKKSDAPTLRRISWQANNQLITITTTDDSITDSELQGLIESVK